MEGNAMKRIVLSATLVMLFVAASAMAQMVPGYGQHMMQGEDEAHPQQQYKHHKMNPGMMGGYGYGMGPQMMGGYGYGMHHPGMMGGYGYGMSPQMMGGYGMGPQMMGGYGYGMHHPGMMGGYGYGMSPQMMGGWGHHGMHHPGGGWGMPPCTQGSQYKSSEDYNKFMDETRDERRKLHSLMFDYGEARRSPETDPEKLQDIEKEIYELRNKIFSQKTK
jgi:hypothetical protein